MEETGEPEENDWPVASHWQTLSHNVVSSTPRHEWGFERWHTQEMQALSVAVWQNKSILHEKIFIQLHFERKKIYEDYHSVLNIDHLQRLSQP